MTTSWVSWFLSAIVLLLLFLSGYVMKNSVRLLISGKRAQGIVVGMDSSSRLTSDTPKALLQTPLVEFVTPEGEHIKVHGRSYSLKPSSETGDEIKVAYDKSNPKDAQLLLWGEFPLGPAGFLLGFAVVIILMWMGGILISEDPTLDDPLHLLPNMIAHFHLNPVRFPVLFILFFAIPTCVVGTYWTYKTTADLRSNGIKAIGHVTGIERVYAKSNDGTTGSGMFPMVDFEDASGTSHTIRRSLAKPLSRLKVGDKVEVIYLTKKPDQGRVNTWDEFWPAPIFFGFCSIAFLVLLFLVLSGYKSMVSDTHDPGIHKELKTSGVSAIATVIKANPKARYLHYRIDKDNRIVTTKLVDFVSLEGEFTFWLAPRTGSEIIRGDQFRAYLDSLKPFEKFYIDFSQRLGSNRKVKSMEEEVIEKE
ncbi:MAG: DUF3592 domain-containing protein [Prolixibacteraceae bacterium]|jgi:hypothetical protein|nr:DUF3592 domain-containing protein [Prolixibacteraceae bacterium]